MGKTGGGCIRAYFFIHHSNTAIGGEWLKPKVPKPADMNRNRAGDSSSRVEAFLSRIVEKLPRVHSHQNLGRKRRSDIYFDTHSFLFSSHLSRPLFLYLIFIHLFTFWSFNSVKSIFYILFNLTNRFIKVTFLKK